MPRGNVTINSSCPVTAQENQAINQYRASMLKNKTFAGKFLHSVWYLQTVKAHFCDPEQAVPPGHLSHLLIHTKVHFIGTPCHTLNSGNVFLQGVKSQSRAGDSAQQVKTGYASLRTWA